MAYFDPQPGQQQPSKYPRTGPHYQKYGELLGFIYDPSRDQYYSDPNYQKNFNQQHGLTPSLTQQILPIAAGAGALAVGTGIAKDPSGYLGGIYNGIKSAGGKLGDLFGGSSSAATPAASAAPSSLPPGMMGLASPGAGISQAPAGLEIVGTNLDGTPMLAASSNAGAAAPAAAEAPGMFGLSGIGSAGNVILPAAGAFGAYDVLSHGSDYSPTRAGLEGAASGAAIGSYFSPIGAAIGAGIGGGVGLIGSLTGGHDHGKIETNRLNDLSSQGVFVPPELLAASPTHARGKDELLQIAQHGGTPQDIKFSQSRDVNDLKGSGQSITGYAAFAQHDPDWFKRSQDERTSYANQLLDQGVVKEHNGTIDIDWNKAVKPPWEVTPQPGTSPNVPPNSTPQGLLGLNLSPVNLNQLRR